MAAAGFRYVSVGRPTRRRDRSQAVHLMAARSERGGRSPAAPGSSARTCASACSPRATRSSASTTSSPAIATTSAPARARDDFQFLQPRRQPASARSTGRCDNVLHFASPASPDRLPRAADPDAQGRLARHPQRARPRQGQGRAASCSPRPPRSTATRWCTRSPRATGATSTRSGRAASTTKPSASPRR